MDERCWLKQPIKCLLRFKHKSKKWYRTIFNSLIDSSITNAYILYKCRNPGEKLTLLKFREQLITEICNDYSVNKKIINPPRIIPGIHQIGLRNKKNCIICSTDEFRKNSKFFCVECDKNVCIVPCFIYCIQRQS